MTDTHDEGDFVVDAGGKMKWLCKIGLHRWRLAGFTTLTLSNSFEICRVCGKGRSLWMYGSAYTIYTQEQVKALLSYDRSLDQVEKQKHGLVEAKDKRKKELA